jgi:hypothetical protein
MAQITEVTFMLSDDTLTKYFEGNPSYWQINLLLGECPILDIRKMKSDIKPHYKIDKKRFGGYYVV